MAGADVRIGVSVACLDRAMKHSSSNSPRSRYLPDSDPRTSFPGYNKLLGGRVEEKPPNTWMTTRMAVVPGC